LQEKVIPEFINELTDMTVLPLDGRQLVREMHRRGINSTFLGKIAVLSAYNFTRELAVREVLTRTIAMLVRDGLSFLSD
jgi:protein TIF31